MAEMTTAPPVDEGLMSDNGTDTSRSTSAYFTNMITWFVATGAIVGAVLLLAVVNCCIENREAIKKMLGLSKSKHPHIPQEEKRIRRDHRALDREEEERETQVHMLWSRFFRHAINKEHSHA